MRFLRRSLVGLLLFSVTLALLAAAGTSVYRALEIRWAEAERTPPARERVFPVNVVTFLPDTVTPIITAYGEVESRRSLELRAPAAGEVVWRAESFEDGAAVQAGQTLLRIDAADAQGRRDSAQADLTEAEADLRDAHRTLEISNDELRNALEQAVIQDRALARQRDLLDRGVGTDAAVEAAELSAQSAEQSVLSLRRSVAQAEAEIDQAMTALVRQRIALDEAERRLAETEIRAPFAGRLGNVAATEGGLVTANERLADLIDPAALEVSFRISARQHAQLASSGDGLPLAPVTASLDVSGVDITATGRVVRESPSVGEGETGRMLYAVLDEAPGFRPGDFVTVRVEEPALDRVALLPASAVDADGRVLVLDAENRLEAADVTLLRRQGDAVIVRAQGLAGRDVVVARTPFLGAGIAVRPVRPGAEAAAAEPEMVELDEDRRAQLIAFVEASDRMPADAKERVIDQLRADRVPARVVARIESRMGG